MELSRYLDLYLAESQEHLRELNRSLLELEQGGGADAVTRAFRSAHTLKGMSATMGFGAVTELAHGLEDRLSEIREGRLEVDPALVDRLLTAADELERAVSSVVVAEASPGTEERAGAGAAEAGKAQPGGEAAGDGDAAEVGGAGTPVGKAKGGRGSRAGKATRPRRGRKAANGGGDGDADSARGSAQSAPEAADAPITGAVAPPAETAMIAVVVVSAISSLPAARAIIARRNVAGVAKLLGSDPEQPGADFKGEMRLFLGAGANPAAVEAAARAAGEIDSVMVASPRAVPAGAGPAPATAGEPAPRARHIRVDLRRLDELADAIGELSVLGVRLRELATAEDLGALREQLERSSTLVDGLRETALAMRMVPVGDVFDRFPRLVRDAARALAKEVDFRIEGRNIEVDRSVIDAMSDPLVHLLRNAVDHGIEAPSVRAAIGKPPRGRVVLRAFRERASVRILVEDDGAGVDAGRVAARARGLGLLSEDDPPPTSGDALLKLLSRPGFSTASEVTEVSGRGVGLDVVVASLRAVGGSLELRTEQRSGSTFAMRLPISLAVSAALRVMVSDESYVVPMTHVREAVELQDVTLARVRGREVLRLRGEAIPFLRLSELLEMPGARHRETAAVIAEVGERRAAFAVDELVAHEQVVVKPFDAAAGMLPFFSGVTLLADGRPALVLDPMTVL